MRFSRKPLAAPAQDYSTARPPSRHRIRGGARGSIICGNYQTLPEITQSRFRGFVIFLTISSARSTWNQTPGYCIKFCTQTLKLQKLWMDFFRDMLVRSLSKMQFTHFRYRDAQFKFCKLSKNGSRELGGGAVLGLLKNCFCRSRQLALFGRDIGVWLIFLWKVSYRFLRAYDRHTVMLMTNRMRTNCNKILQKKNKFWQFRLLLQWRNQNSLVTVS